MGRGRGGAACSQRADSANWRMCGASGAQGGERAAPGALCSEHRAPDAWCGGAEAEGVRGGAQTMPAPASSAQSDVHLEWWSARRAQFSFALALRS
jgi:hypothetical protein